MKEKIKVGLIGAGYWGKNLLRNFYELGTLETVCEKEDRILAQRKKEYKEIRYTKEYKEILGNKDIKGVVIATPAVTHYDLARQALEADKDVFVEKPLALMIEQGDELVQMALKKDRILMVGHILQYHPAILKLKEILDKGELGDIHYIYSNRLNIGKLRNEENILWSFAPHDISVILMLVNKFPKEIKAIGGAYVQKDIYDVTLTNFIFHDNMRGHIFVSWLHPFKEQKLVIVGKKKMAVFDDTADKKLLLYPHRIEWENKVPVARKAQAEEVSIEASEPLKNECKAFLQSIQTRKPPRTDGREGLQVLQFLKLAEKSMKEKVAL
ncbi:MAG: Gfo/Idh/MocA family oxidoreductase [Spirochaetes bacterium]|nr:Gfo/Idh/MocA family oxidoreductase [Spirochaetota bacterium]